jgi:hypothetical protein
MSHLKHTFNLNPSYYYLQTNTVKTYLFPNTLHHAELRRSKCAETHVTYILLCHQLHVLPYTVVHIRMDKCGHWATSSPKEETDCPIFSYFLSCAHGSTGNSNTVHVLKRIHISGQHSTRIHITMNSQFMYTIYKQYKGLVCD